MSDTQKPDPAGRTFILPVEWCVLLIAILASLILMSLVTWRAGFGYDFSDEGMYLNWIANPQAYKVSVTQFGFIYHPIYLLVGGDIALLRRVNILLTLGLAWILCDVLLRRVIAKSECSGAWHRVALAGLAFVLSTSVLAQLDLWEPTPNYNSLALQALLIAGMGMILAGPHASRQSTLGWVLIGVSGWLAFMAKPTTALALAVVIGVYLLLTGKLRPRTLAISLVTVAILGVVTAWIIDGSVVDFIRRLAVGAEDAGKLNNNHTLSDALRWDGFQLATEVTGPLAFVVMLVLVASCLTSSKDETKRLWGSALSLLPCLLSVAISLGFATPQLSPTRFQVLLIAAAPLGVVFAFLVLSCRNLSRLIPFDRLALAISFTAFPYVYVFGSDRNYWELGPEAAFFWILAGCVLLGSLPESEISWRAFLPLAAGAALCTTTLLFLSMEYPNRQPGPLHQDTDVMQINGTGSQLLVPREVAHYVTELQQLALAVGFKAGDPMIDLTGRYPGALYALGARSVGRPWMIGGYKGSDNLNIAALARVSPDELRKAWILTEPTGPRNLSPDILKRVGLDLSHGYQEAGAIDSPAGEYPGHYKQHLFKPAR